MVEKIAAVPQNIQEHVEKQIKDLENEGSPEEQTEILKAQWCYSVIIHKSI